VLSIEKGFKPRQCFERVAELIEQIDQEMPYLYDDHYGHINACPSNLGTAMRIIFVVDFPTLG
jgi:protein-arginine kinase